jgi:hypothetical protein
MSTNEPIKKRRRLQRAFVPRRQNPPAIRGQFAFVRAIVEMLSRQARTAIVRAKHARFFYIWPAQIVSKSGAKRVAL